MRKIYISFLFLLIGLVSRAQSVDILNPIYGTSGNAPMGTSNYAASESIYTEAEVGGASSFTTAGTSINRIAYNVSTVGTGTAFGSVNIYMKDVAAATTTFTAGVYSTTGYTLVYSGTYNATVTGWNSVDLTTPYVRASGTNLQVLVERFDNATHASFAFNCTNTAGTNMIRRANQAAAITAGTTSLAVSAFRPSIRLVHAIANDAEVTSFTSLGKYPVGYGPGNNNIVATISNVGTTTMTNIPVNLTITGTNAYSTSQNIASLAAGASTTVTFAAYNPTAIGSSSINISIGADGNAANNTGTAQNQVTTTNTFALANNDAATVGGSIGFGTGSGNLLIKMPVYKNNSVVSARISISSDAAVAANTVYAVLLSSTGTLLSQSPNYVIQNGDLGTYVTFTFPAPVAVTAGTTYYIGLAQTVNATAYYPVNTQSTKTNLSHSTAIGGGTLADYATFGSLMIESVFQNVFPVTLTSFTGTRAGTANKLQWVTANESNNAYFDVERSADGKSFSKIASVRSKAENGSSSADLFYTQYDERPLAGTNYYRLKQVDKDGRTTYSVIVTIKGDKEVFAINTLYPNPAKDVVNLTISSPNADKANISFTDVSGKTIKTVATTLVKGDNNISINVNSLAAGTYFVRMINSKQEITTTQFIKN